MKQSSPGTKPSVKRKSPQPAKVTPPISIRFSAKEREEIEKAAEEDGLPFGSWIRHVALYACRKNLRFHRTDEFRRQYRKVAT